MGVGIGKVIATVVIVAELVGCAVPVANVPDPVPPVVETEATTQAVIPEATKAEGFVAYRIYGREIPLEWQRYLYNELAERGFSWYWPYAVCQIQQESCWNQYSTNGYDSGITQQKEVYWPARCERYGVPGASIWDVYAQFHVYACMMCDYLTISGGNVGWALSAYFLGIWDYSETYVGHVLSHLPALEVMP